MITQQRIDEIAKGGPFKPGELQEILSLAGKAIRLREILDEYFCPPGPSYPDACKKYEEDGEYACTVCTLEAARKEAER